MITNLSSGEVLHYYTTHIPKLHPSGGELRGPCPIHRGQRDSFAVNLETGAWFCHSSCNRGGGIEDFEMALTGLDRKAARAAVCDFLGRQNGNGRRIVKTYPYVDEQGTLLFECVRFEPKDFAQRRPDGNGDWIWNLKGVRRVPYRLPDLMKAKIVFICEGEKDVEALRALGVCASCNPMGAGKWRREYNEFFRAKQAYVIPDQDEPGREHAAKVVESLTGIASFVRLLPLPEAKDPAEWIERGGTLDALVALVEREDGDPGSRAEAVTASTPAEAGAKLVEDTGQYIRLYVVLPESAYLPLTLWVIVTHAVQLFDCFPYIAAVSATKRSGKTRLAEVLEALVRRPWRGTAPSPAALYRMLTGAPTLLLDETELLNSKNKSETTLILLAVLNAGHRKGATIPRCEGPQQEVKQFPVYGPKFFAAIGRLPDTLLDRSIIVHMKRRSKAQPVKRFRLARATAEAKPIHDRAAGFAQTYAADIERAYQEVLDADLGFLSDRDADLWTPLFTMCSIMIPERLKELEKCARVLSAAKAGDDTDDSWALTLLKDIKAVWADGEDKLETAILLERLKALEESPWLEQQLTPRKLARTLRPFEVEPRTVRIGDRTPKGYFYEQLKAAFDLYLDDLSATCDTNQ